MPEDRRPADDDTILAGEQLYLRVYPGADSIKQTEDGGRRPTTGGVKGRDMDEPLSVDLGSLCIPQQTRDRGTDGNFYVAAFTAAMVREAGLRVRKDPIPEGQPGGPNDAHGLVYGTRRDAAGNLIGGLTGGEYGRIARFARIVLDPVPPAAVPPIEVPPPPG
jgi:hypothetical protein